MPRDKHSLTIADLSVFAKNLRAGLKDHDKLPSHAALLTLIAKAAGYQNYQQLKAGAVAPLAHTEDKSLVRALRCFEGGTMIRWPNRTKVQGLCLWVFWALLPANKALSEKEVNEVLKAAHSFGDHALLRRSLIDHKLARRTANGKTYQRIEQRPPEPAIKLIKALQRPS